MWKIRSPNKYLPRNMMNNSWLLTRSVFTDKLVIEPGFWVNNSVFAYNKFTLITIEEALEIDGVLTGDRAAFYSNKHVSWAELIKSSNLDTKENLIRTHKNADIIVQPDLDESILVKIFLLYKIKP